MRPDATADPMLDRIVGSFRLVQLLGEGGTSSVYLGERGGEFRQRAAVKLLREGLHDRDTRERFRSERKVLAKLQHPDIVQIMDGGVTPEGIPYLVMDYVEGVPLDQYCHTHQLSVNERLALVIRMLEAVEYAHRRQIAHCDLKFSNVLVTSAGEVRLLDFGSTKLLDPAQLGVDPQLTRPGSRPFTPDFASPEQLQGRPLGTATDIYSAAVILYILLVGKHPFESLRQQPIQLMRAILLEEPEPPDQRSDLDFILLKALRKEPELRYASAAQFAGDVRNFLQNRPVIARRGSHAYRAWKFVKRNRAMALAAAILFAAVLAGAGGVLWESVRAQRSRTVAQHRFDDARKLTGSLIVDFYDAVRKLDHSEPALNSLERWSEETLQRLSAQSGNDASLQTDLAEYYLKLGILEAAKPAAALASFDRGLRLADQALKNHPADRPTILVKIRLLESRASTEKTIGKPSDAVRDTAFARQLSDQIVK